MVTRPGPLNTRLSSQTAKFVTQRSEYRSKIYILFNWNLHGIHKALVVCDGTLIRTSGYVFA